MTRFFIILLVIGAYFILASGVTSYLSARKNKRAQIKSEEKSFVSYLPEKHQDRLNKSLQVLERYPDLKNDAGMKIGPRYKRQLKAVCERYSKATANPLRDDKEIELLLEKGLKTIEKKIEWSLILKGDEARDQLDIYVRFLDAAD